MEGGEAPKGAYLEAALSSAARATLSECCHSLALRARSPFGAPPRLSPETRRPAGSAPGHASWDAASAGVTRLHLSQSRDCTSRAGRSTGVNDARSRPGAGRNPARRDRPRSTFESTLAKGPSVNEMGRDVSTSVTIVKTWSLNRRRQKASETNSFKPSSVGSAGHPHFEPAGSLIGILPGYGDR